MSHLLAAYHNPACPSPRSPEWIRVLASCYTTSSLDDLPPQQSVEGGRGGHPCLDGLMQWNRSPREVDDEPGSVLWMVEWRDWCWKYFENRMTILVFCKEYAKEIRNNSKNCQAVSMCSPMILVATIAAISLCSHEPSSCCCVS